MCPTGRASMAHGRGWPPPQSPPRPRTVTGRSRCEGRSLWPRKCCFFIRTTRSAINITRCVFVWDIGPLSACQRRRRGRDRSWQLLQSSSVALMKPKHGKGTSLTGPPWLQRRTREDLGEPPSHAKNVFQLAGESVTRERRLPEGGGRRLCRVRDLLLYASRHGKQGAMPCVPPAGPVARASTAVHLTPSPTPMTLAAARFSAAAGRRASPASCREPRKGRELVGAGVAVGGWRGEMMRANHGSACPRGSRPAERAALPSSHEERCSADIRRAMGPDMFASRHRVSQHLTEGRGGDTTARRGRAASCSSLRRDEKNGERSITGTGPSSGAATMLQARRSSRVDERNAASLPKAGLLARPSRHSARQSA